ncbi:MAG: YgaP family membrane protein [Desulfuromonadales bacterium]
MLHNVCSTTERVVRVIVGLAVLSLLVLLEGTERYWGLLGLIPIATAIFRYCPISHLLKIDTCKIKHA